MTFRTLALESIADGVYTGECDVDFIYAKVAVTMKNGQIQSIDLLEHKNERGTSAEVMTEKIVEAQNLEVDAVSGTPYYMSCSIVTGRAYQFYKY